MVGTVGRTVVLGMMTLGALAVDNGLGLTPPMGWRSWNTYAGRVTQDKMMKVMDKMAERRNTVNGVPTSMKDLGFISVGLDDNWQACGTGYKKSFHDEEGNPLVNKATFPSMSAMTAHGHSLNLTVGWYMNNCICRENQFHDRGYITKHMQRSVQAIVDNGFDGVKLDGCGEFLNLTWWSQLLNQTGRPVMIENCHWGNTVPGIPGGGGNWAAPCTGTTTPSDCPYNFYRSSGDIQANWNSVVANLQTTRKFQDLQNPVSRPGSWAYPDMLEVGNLKTFAEDRAHFGAWAIVSSPLILGHDVTNDAINDKIWPIISNKEVIAVNQAWYGHPGRLVLTQNRDGVDDMNFSYQVWAKPLSRTETAVMVLTNEGHDGITVTVTLQSLGITGPVQLRDLYQHKDLGTVSSGGQFTTASLAGHDSAFFRLTQTA